LSVAKTICDSCHITFSMNAEFAGSSASVRTCFFRPPIVRPATGKNIDRTVCSRSVGVNKPLFLFAT
jgi:hypothetical protein